LYGLFGRFSGVSAMSPVPFTYAGDPQGRDGENKTQLTWRVIGVKLPSGALLNLSSIARTPYA